MNAARFAGTATLAIATLAFATVGLLPHLAQGQTKDDSVQILEGAVHPKAQWKNAGHATPEATMETFMWGTREGKTKELLACFVASDAEQLKLEMQKDEAAFSQKMKEMSSTAETLRIIAVKSIDGNTAQVKFHVDGWGEDKGLVHTLVKSGDKWLMSGSTHEPEW